MPKPKAPITPLQRESASRQEEMDSALKAIRDAIREHEFVFEERPELRKVLLTLVPGRKERLSSDPKEQSGYFFRWLPGFAQAKSLFFRVTSPVHERRAFWEERLLNTTSTHVRFNFNESKTIEALVFIATRWPGITPFFLAKVLFFADRDHLRSYCRPVTGDVYIAMADGPVPSHVYDMVKGNLDFFGDPEAVTSAVRVDRNERYPRFYAEKDPNLDLLSETDVVALENSIAFCRGRSFRDLSNLTHQELAWIEAPANGEMNPELLVPEDMREEVREAAAYAVL